MKHLNFILTGGTGLLLLLFSCSGKKPAPQTEEPVAVNIIHPATGELSTTIASSGAITAYTTLELSFKTGGIVEKTLVDAGQFVSKGQLLAELNTTELNAQLKQSNLNVSKLSRDQERLSQLVKDTVATMEDLQNNTTALATAKSQRDAIRYNLSLNRIYAPSSGIILSKNVNSGEFKEAGNPIFSIGSNPDDQKWVFKISVSDQDRIKLNPGQETTITLDALSGKPFSGKVIKLDNVPDPATGTYNCYVGFDPGAAKLVYGLTGKMSLRADSSPGGTILPLDALFSISSDTGYLYLAGKDSIARKKQVHILRVSGKQVVIKEVLPASAMVITSGKDETDAGKKVKIIK